MSLKLGAQGFEKLCVMEQCVTLQPLLCVRFTPGAGLQAEKKKTGPSPADVEAIKVMFLTGSFVYIRSQGMNYGMAAYTLQILQIKLRLRIGIEIASA